MSERSEQVAVSAVPEDHNELVFQLLFGSTGLIFYTWWRFFTNARLSTRPVYFQLTNSVAFLTCAVFV